MIFLSRFLFRRSYGGSFQERLRFREYAYVGRVSFQEQTVRDEREIFHRKLAEHNFVKNERRAWMAIFSLKLS